MKNSEKLISKTDNIYIAGHKGMVGGSILKKLNAEGYFNILKATKSELDLTNEYDVKKWFNSNKPDVVILAAAKVGGIEANNNNPTEFILENLKIQNNVIEAAWKNKVKRFLFLGSSCIYPKFSKQPIKEEELLTSALEATNESYALAKIAGIRLCKSLLIQYKFDAISLMPTNLYGPGDNYDLNSSHVLPALIKRFHRAKIDNHKEVICWGSGNPYREFLHVDDLARACLFALERWDPFSSDAPKDEKNNNLSFLNVGTGKEIQIKELAKLISEILNYEGNIIWDTNKPDGTPRKQLDISRISKLGWYPEISLKEGIKSTIDIFKKL